LPQPFRADLADESLQSDKRSLIAKENEGLVRSKLEERRRVWLLLTYVPRVLVAGTAVAGLLASSGCVSTLRYEEATSAAEVANEGQRRASLQVEACEGRVSKLEQEIGVREQRVELGEQKLQEEQYQRGILAKERGEDGALVQSLQSELARAQQTLAAYAADKARLEQELAAERQRTTDGSLPAAPVPPP
jgi:hypothetical protein